MRKKNKTIQITWFTLIELMVAITIFSIIMLSVFVIYKNIIDANKKLELTRTLQENSRNIIENLATEIREKWVDYDYYKAYTEDLDNTWSGNKVLSIKNSWEYCMQKVQSSCDISCYTNPESCYLGKLDTQIKLSDERVEIKNLKFYIGWKPNSTIDNEEKVWKVTLVFDLGIKKWTWLAQMYASWTSIHIQTTISSKIYKNLPN